MSPSHAFREPCKVYSTQDYAWQLSVLKDSAGCKVLCCFLSCKTGGLGLEITTPVIYYPGHSYMQGSIWATQLYPQNTQNAWRSQDQHVPASAIWKVHTEFPNPYRQWFGNSYFNCSCWGSFQCLHRFLQAAIFQVDIVDKHKPISRKKSPILLSHTPRN